MRYIILYVRKRLFIMMQDISLCRLCAVLLCASMLAACSGSKTGVAVNGRYQRAPVVVADTAQLTLQNMLIDAKLQQELGNNGAALTLYRRILARDSSYGSANYEMSQIFSSQLRLDSAVRYGERAVRAEPNNVWCRLQCAALYKNMGQNDKLIREWETIVRQNPEAMDYYYELSNAYMQQGDYKNAVATLNRVEHIVGITEGNSLLKQKIWNAAGETKKADQEIERLAAALPNDGKYNAILAESNMKAGNYAKAKSYYDKVLAANPDDEYIHISLAQYYKATGDEEHAYRELKQGFANPKLSSETKVQVLASFYTKEEFYDKYSRYAYDLLDDAMRSSDDSTAYALLYGDVLMRQGKYADAMRQFKSYIAKDSSEYDVWEALLLCENAMEGNGGELLNDARRAAALFPLHQLPYYVQAVHAYDQKQYGEALTLLRQCEKIGFTKGYLETQVYSLMADCYHALGQDAQSFACFDRLLQLRPDDATVLNNYAYYLCERGERLDEALGMAEKAVKQEGDNSVFLDTYAWALYKMGRYDEARTQMRKCLDKDKQPNETLLRHWELIRSAK